MKNTFMHKALFLFLFYAWANVVTGQARFHDSMAQARTAEEFKNLDVQTGIEVQLIQADKEEVAVSASTEQWRDYIKTEVSDGTLKIYFKPEVKDLVKNSAHKNLKAYVACRNLQNINVTTGASIEIQGVFSAADLYVNVNSGGTLNGEIDATTLNIEQSTGSVVTIIGKSNHLTVKGSTGSQFKGKNLISDMCTAQVSTGADAIVQVKKELVAKASTGGTVKYMGDVTNRDITKSTGGRVSKI